ncbi:AAWKG family protein [Streptomyces sp. NPDC002181]|uniref:AAWKG family protein n=1 Tax=Streptomyces sp. NPDC002181 TaxID=3364635 RepID=UPI0036C13D72
MPVQPAHSVNDYWHLAVKLLTGADMPLREDIFDKLVGNQHIPLMKVEITDGAEPYYGVIDDIVYDLEWRTANSGWRIENTDFVVPFYTRLDGAGTTASPDTEVKMLRARITLLGSQTLDAPPAGGVVAGHSFNSGDKAFDDVAAHTEWSDKQLSQYSYAGGKALEALWSSGSTVGFEWNSLFVDRRNAVDLNSFREAAEAFDRAAKFFKKQHEELKDWEFDLGREEAWKGQAAGVFRDLIHGLVRKYGAYTKQLPLTQFHRSEYGDDLRHFMEALRLAGQELYYKWNHWQLYTGNPLRWLHDVLLDVTDSVWQNNIKKVRVVNQDIRGGMINIKSFHVRHDGFSSGYKDWGALDDLATWKRIGEEAIRLWQEQVIRSLGQAGKEALLSVENSWNDAKFKAVTSTNTMNLEQELKKDKAEADKAAQEKRQHDLDAENRRRQKEMDDKAEQAEKRAEEREKKQEKKQEEQEQKQEQRQQEQEQHQKEQEAKQEAKQAEQERKQEQRQQEQEAQQQIAFRRAEQEREEQKKEQKEQQHKQEERQRELEEKQERKQEEQEHKQEQRQQEQEAQQQIAFRRAEQEREQQKKEQKEQQHKQEERQRELEEKQERKQEEQEHKQEQRQQEQEQHQKEQEAKQEKLQQEQQQRQERLQNEQQERQEKIQNEQREHQREQEQKQEQRLHEQEAKQEQREKEQLERQDRLQHEQEARQDRLQQEQQNRWDDSLSRSLPGSGDGTTRLDPDGSLTKHFPDGTTTRIDPATGEVTATLPDGTQQISDLQPGGSVRNPDGSWTTLNPDRTLTTDFPDGSSSVVDPQKSLSTTTFPDGTTITTPVTPGGALPNHPDNPFDGLSSGTSLNNGSSFGPRHEMPRMEEDLFDENLDAQLSPSGIGARESGGEGGYGGGPGGSPMLPMGTRINGGTSGGEGSGERVRTVLDDGQQTVVRRRAAPHRRDEELAAAQRGGTATSGGSPFMPPMGGQGGGGGQQTESSDRERDSWVAEDDDVWGTDEGGAPAALGRD